MKFLLQRAALLAASLVSVLFLAACGQKGPLYMPETPAPSPPAETKASQDRSSSASR